MSHCLLHASKLRKISTICQVVRSLVTKIINDVANCPWEIDKRCTIVVGKIEQFIHCREYEQQRIRILFRLVQKISNRFLTIKGLTETGHRGDAPIDDLEFFRSEIPIDSLGV